MNTHRLKWLFAVLLLGLLPQVGMAATNIGRGNWGADPQSPDAVPGI